MPTRDEQRQAVLGCLATHGDVTWHDGRAAVAFADEVLDLAQRLGRVDVVPAMRPVRVATEEERSRHVTRIRERLSEVRIATSAPLSDAEGERAHGVDVAVQGSSAGDTGGRA